MPRKRRGRKLSSSQRKFQRVAKAANAKCHRDTNSVAAYKTCMRSAMKAGLGGRKRGRGRKRRRR